MLQPDGIVLHGFLGTVEEFVIDLDELGAQHTLLVADGTVVNPQVLARSQQGTLHHLEVLVYPAVGGTVIVLEERACQGIGVDIRIPHQFAEQIGTEFREIAAADAVDLREVHGRMVAGEELDVGLQDMKVGEWTDDVVEIDAVIPDKDVVGDGTPSLQCSDKPLSRGVVRKRNLAFAVDVAEHDVDIRQRSGLLRRLAGEEVSQGAELLVGITLCQTVHKPYVSTAHSPLLFIDLHAFGAVAVGVVAVVLADAYEVFSRIRLEDAVELRTAGFKYGRIAQTPLAVVARTAFAVEERVVFRMAFAEPAGRKDAVESVYPQVSDKGLVGFFQPEPVVIDGVLATVAVGLPVAESRSLHRVHLGDGDVRGRMLCRAVGLRDFTVEGIAFARQIVDAEMPFEECGHGIYGTFPPSGLEVERSVVSSPYFETVLSGIGCPVSDDDVSVAWLAFS